MYWVRECTDVLKRKFEYYNQSTIKLLTQLDVKGKKQWKPIDKEKAKFATEKGNNYESQSS